MRSLPCNNIWLRPRWWIILISLARKRFLPRPSMKLYLRRTMPVSELSSVWQHPLSTTDKAIA